jgi:hydroxyacylglutathione hydrolase
VVLDLRPAMAFLGGHLPGSLHLPPPPDLEALAPRVLPGDWARDRGLVLLVRDQAQGEAAVGALVAGGFGGAVVGLLHVSALSAWARGGGKLEIVPQITPEEAVDGLEAGALGLLDVRDALAWAAGRIPGSTHLPLDRLGELAWSVREPEHRIGPGPVAVISERGLESPVAAGLLQRMGITGVQDVAGGFLGWGGERG